MIHYAILFVNRKRIIAIIGDLPDRLCNKYRILRHFVEFVVKNQSGGNCHGKKSIEYF